MRTVSVVNRTRDIPLGERVALADSYFTRLRGLLGRPEPREGEGLLILPSAGVHMYGMRYPLDVLLLDGKGTVVAVYPGLAPWGRTRLHRGARAALELPVGTIGESGTEEGDLLEWNGRKDAD
jgi:uncharacterized membrane protein (UPF0127 family)